MAVVPIILCGNCRTPVGAGDKFCSKCGTEIEWITKSATRGAAELERGEGTVVCQSCGSPNARSNIICRSCGTSLAGVRIQGPEKGQAKEPKAVTQKSRKSPSAHVKGERWKVYSVAVGIIIVVLLLVGQFRNPPREVASSSVDQGLPAGSNIIAEIDALQKTVDADGTDTGAILRLANVLHDAKFTPRAIEMYKKYLRQKPDDPDARVDMAICYFESGDAQTAIKEMEHTLRIAPKHQMAMFNLGIVHLNGGNLQKSNEWFKKCIAVNPSADIAKRAQQIVAQHTP